ncbi:membrane protein insertion efficiency factor YidD [Georgenia thermotolerans]|uniref:membrane protein insertion efficiency factor YidD n=1 Tax=Georgenia thermotolerans TaxID=527326 RepID=UPI0029CA65F4|nr:membrane protein insertion efficiency factor YidD [Georgenia thermotolerans]
MSVVTDPRLERHGPAAHPGHPRSPSGDERPERRPRNPLTWLLLGVVRVYQLVISPWLAPTCKYYPSCSAYAVTALRRHGAGKGALLAAWRLLRCNPWSLGGVDHVPPRGRWSNRDAAPRAPARAQESQREHGKPRTLGAGTWGARTSAPKDR